MITPTSLPTLKLPPWTYLIYPSPTKAENHNHGQLGASHPFPANDETATMEDLCPHPPPVPIHAKLATMDSMRPHPTMRQRKTYNRVRLVSSPPSQPTIKLLRWAIRILAILLAHISTDTINGLPSSSPRLANVQNFHQDESYPYTFLPAQIKKITMDCSHPQPLAKPKLKLFPWTAHMLIAASRPM